MVLKAHFQPIFVGLYCEDEIRAHRLLARGWSAQAVEDHRNFNRWLLQNADTAFTPPMPLIDTSVAAPDEVAM
ncbi:hypothetical protein [Paenibacillus donghaensis]|uniref:Uncharacterized protein n=1 Tax=Paenibacillus donghaensis TaxID=414771 RepID=A0A2Z2KBR9_9BACL|nr:hypothetical protein [Paenibacillus donghaensis]ASA23204.1 hypothetical protein B9T62_21785 [Paenibacillus donghaensis]